MKQKLRNLSLPLTAIAACFAILIGMTPPQALADGNNPTDCIASGTCVYVPVGSTKYVIPGFQPAPTPSCKAVTNNNCPAEVMVPDGTAPEWNSFLQSILANGQGHCVTVSSCPTLAVTLSASPNSVTAGGSTTLTWTITGNIGALKCTPTSTDNSWAVTSPYTYAYVSNSTTTGTATVTPTSSTSTTYTLSCTDGTNTNAGATTVMVTAPVAACANASWVCPAGVYEITSTLTTSSPSGTIDLAGLPSTGKVSWSGTPDGGNASFQDCELVNNVPTMTKAAHSAYDGGGWVLYDTYALQSSFGCNFPGTWTAGACSATCGSGTTAAPTCSTGNTADCDPNAVPISGQSCNTQVCSSVCSSSSSNSYSGTCADAHGVPINGSPYGNCVVYGPNDDGCQANWNGFWIPPGPNSCYICASTYTGTWVAGSCSATACGTSGTINAPTCSTGNIADCDPNSVIPASGQTCSAQSCVTGCLAVDPPVSASSGGYNLPAASIGTADFSGGVPWTCTGQTATCQTGWTYKITGTGRGAAVGSSDCATPEGISDILSGSGFLNGNTGITTGGACNPAFTLLPDTGNTTIIPFTKNFVCSDGTHETISGQYYSDGRANKYQINITSDSFSP